MAVYAIADEVPESSPYIIAGKRYEAKDQPEPGLFTIKDENNGTRSCLWEGCAHLEFGNWRRVEGAE